MKFSQFFIDRPIFAIVMSVFITIVGGLAYFTLPVAQYPEVAPPTVQVTARYPGASAETIAETVATPLEQQINGVEGMLYLSSQATGDGNLTITATFEVGSDLDEAQVRVQNRVAIAEPRLPEPVRRLGVVTQKASPDLLLVAHMYSPDGSRDDLYITGAAQRVRDELIRLDGVGTVTVFGARDYSMRVWLDPDRIAAMGMTPGEVLAAMRSQNVQVSSGLLNQQPTVAESAFEVSVQTTGRLDKPEEFARIIVKRGEEGRIVRLGDVARVELGAANYGTRAYLDTSSAVALGITQRPGSNALNTAGEVLEALDRLAADFPDGLEYDVIYNPTGFIRESIDAVVHTMIEAVALVIAVVLLFLGTWRAAVTPILAIPVSLVGTFALLSALGYSINNLSLFGLVLAVGIVVDDAIIVVEGIEKHIREGLSPRDAARKTMSEVSGALVAVSLVLAAVFIPTAAVPGISGLFYRQFAMTITAATAISLLVSLTLSPAMAAMLLKPHGESKPGLLARPFVWALGKFDRGFDRASDGYGWMTRRLVRMPLMMLAVFGGLLVLTDHQFGKVPGGFIPQQDQGYYIAVVQLPPGSSLERTDRVVRHATRQLLDIDGVEHTAVFTGLNGATLTTESNTGVIFLTTTAFEKREAEGYDAQAVLGEARRRMAAIKEAAIFVIAPPPVPGIGTGGGFKMVLQDTGGAGAVALAQAAQSLAAAANADPGLVAVFSQYNTGTPRVWAEIDRERAEMLNVPVARINEALEVYLGSAYVNDFNLFGRTYNVTVQADAPFRETADDVARLRVRSDNGEMVPLGAVASFSDTTGPLRQPRYNLYPSAAVQGQTMPGVSSAEALERMEQIAAQVLPQGIGYEWTELSYQEKNTDDTAALVFAFAVLFVILVLAAQYESWALPAAVILIVPMVLLSAITGVGLAGLDNNILVQIGFVVLVALASKNAILIVEFAKQAEEEGKDRWAAAVQAARTRLRPIVMTSLAFILGVVPLMLATGAGAEMRQSLGVSVFSGMLGVTVFGLVFSPVFYVIVRGIETRLTRNRGRPDGQET
ncbi:multidrug efflux RND transporter permease subunit [Leisingera daeponensis]|uniref:Efflux pump membrane transporter n=1 Tax=Leisingera daeponensis TaxID=405746 RepID=A0ABS7NJV6_9RHOB|nr:multidrug efflux RND transporter permease subunit [Leisingera daeponensis]MBY6141503.1 multidrug efflux RND transporter permease subunit [Leisingera daeponensis]